MSAFVTEFEKGYDVILKEFNEIKSKFGEDVHKQVGGLYFMGVIDTLMYISKVYALERKKDEALMWLEMSELIQSEFFEQAQNQFGFKTRDE
jgi:hypothetical protein